eukprot:TRINITY_DN20352_c0_g1_i1.p1 TRINITY_DN20352_c0_g1~~TRINITY_DN20352_c0_g1_i1.p1  ORF type:complete len:733 (+),score=140.78 TRINITY_DN20352_c0_g1_i1:74-2272(+)
MDKAIIPGTFRANVPTETVPRVRFCRYVLRVTSGNSTVKRVLLVLAPSAGTQGTILVASRDGTIKRVLEISKLHALSMYVKPNHKHITLVFGMQFPEPPLKIELKPTEDNPTHPSPNEITTHINHIRRTTGLTPLELQTSTNDANFGDMKGMVVSAADFLENGKKRIENKDYMRERRQSRQQSVSTQPPPKVEVEEEAVKKLVFDEEYEKTLDEKINQIQQRMEKSREEIAKMKYLASEPPETETLMEAAEDSSADANSTHHKDHDDDGEPPFDISADPTISYNSSNSGHEPSSPDEHAVKKLLSSPYPIRRKAQKSLPRGVHWQDLDFKTRMQAVQEAASKKVNIIRNVGEPLGIKVSSSMILTKVDPLSCSAEAGLDKYVGYEIVQLNGVPVSSTQDIAQNQSTLMQFSLVDPTGLVDEGDSRNRCCKNCASWVAEGFAYCTECGHPASRKKKLRKRTNKPLISASKEIAGELVRAPPHLPRKANVKAVGLGQNDARQQTLKSLQQATYSDIIRKDVIAGYLKSITSQYELISSSSDHSSDRAGRHGHGERHLWGKSAKISKHPFETHLNRLLTISSDITTEIARLKELSKSIESGELFAHLERYKLHLHIEKDLLHRWLAGIARSKGATGDPRKKNCVKRLFVRNWLRDVRAANPPKVVVPKPVILVPKPVVESVEPPREVDQRSKVDTRSRASSVSCSTSASRSHRVVKKDRRPSLIADDEFVSVTRQ